MIQSLQTIENLTDLNSLLLRLLLLTFPLTLILIATRELPSHIRMYTYPYVSPANPEAWLHVPGVNMK